MGKVDAYREILKGLHEWDSYLLAESGLPGPRGNLELAQAVADTGDEALFRRYSGIGPKQAPVGSQGEFLTVCGAIGLGRLVAEGQRAFIPVLRSLAADPRWRVREGVAMALQRWGDADMEGLLAEMTSWGDGNALEQRAAAAALCEPRLLRDPVVAVRVLEILDRITASIVRSRDRKSDAFLALRKGLGYAWSVAVVALPDAGKPAMEKWLASGDRDVRWIMKENLRKNRLERMDGAWVAHWLAELAR
jgi:hypothetical protein